MKSISVEAINNCNHSHLEIDCQMYLHRHVHWWLPAEYHLWFWNSLRRTNKIIVIEGEVLRFWESTKWIILNQSLCDQHSTSLWLYDYLYYLSSHHYYLHHHWFLSCELVSLNPWVYIYMPFSFSLYHWYQILLFLFSFLLFYLKPEIKCNLSYLCLEEARKEVKKISPTSFHH